MLTMKLLCICGLLATLQNVVVAMNNPYQGGTAPPVDNESGSEEDDVQVPPQHAGGFGSGTHQQPNMMMHGGVPMHPSQQWPQQSSPSASFNSNNLAQQYGSQQYPGMNMPSPTGTSTQILNLAQTLNRSIVEDLKMYLSTIAEAKAIEQPSIVRNVLAVKSKPQRKRKNSENSSSGSNTSRKSQWSRSQPICWRCGSEHSCRRCRHIKTVCRKCNTSGHLERMCAPHQAWLKKNGNGTREEKAANSVRLGRVFLVNSVNQKHRLIEIPIEMNGKKVDFVIDSGTESTVLCEEAHRRIGSPRVSRCKERAKYPDGSTRTFLGKGLATFSIGGQTHTGRFFVSKNGSKNLLGTEMMENLGLMKSIQRSLAVKLPAENVQGTKEQHHQSAVREGVIKKPSDKHQRRTKRVAVGATGVASRSNSQSWRAGYVDNRAGIRQDGVSLRKAPSENIGWGRPMMDMASESDWKAIASTSRQRPEPFGLR
uniref:CCHC-type domain-containing protein n=1 Tax=Globodera pallida TaxID=36090 RepID=A0A183C9Y7_GLOPA